MKQGVKIYDVHALEKYNKQNGKPANAGGVAIEVGTLTHLEFVQLDIRKQNQQGWYVHQVVASTDNRFPIYMVVYRRDEEM